VLFIKTFKTYKKHSKKLKHVDDNQLNAVSVSFEMVEKPRRRGG